MKRPFCRLFFPLLLLSLPLEAADSSSPSISPYFSPNGGCTQAIIDSLGAAKSSILVQAYSFTSAPIAKALVDAHKRGVDVQVILDKSQGTVQPPSLPTRESPHTLMQPTKSPTTRS